MLLHWISCCLLPFYWDLALIFISWSNPSTILIQPFPSHSQQQTEQAQQNVKLQRDLLVVQQKCKQFMRPHCGCFYFPWLTTSQGTASDHDSSRANSPQQQQNNTQPAFQGNQNKQDRKQFVLPAPRELIRAPNDFRALEVLIQTHQEKAKKGKKRDITPFFFHRFYPYLETGRWITVPRLVILPGDKMLLVSTDENYNLWGGSLRFGNSRLSLGGTLESNLFYGLLMYSSQGLVGGPFYPWGNGPANTISIKIVQPKHFHFRFKHVISTARYKLQLHTMP